MLLLILIVLLFFALAGGYWGRGSYGNASWSPVGLIVLLLVVLWLLGYLGPMGVR